MRQKPQSFLIRSHYLVKPNLGPEQLKRRGGALGKAIHYRTSEYGSLPGILPAAGGSAPAANSIESTTFFGLPIRMHKRVVGPLACVEREIKRRCRRDNYRPKAIGGYRSANTYRGDEVSNHAFGIAIDIDPDRNPCCGCVAPWPEHPKCAGKAANIYERTTIPRCWVRAFKKYGFYWLGEDQLMDTMHFEFLGNPDRIDPN